MTVQKSYIIRHGGRTGLSLLSPAAFTVGLSAVLDLIIIYQVIPVFPFHGMDGAKVLKDSKALYAAGVLVSLAAIIAFRS